MGIVSAERSTQLEKKIAANSARQVDELIKTYEGSLIADDEDRRVFEESNRAHRDYDRIPQHMPWNCSGENKVEEFSENAARGRHPRL